jgi:hypothetical protein
VSGTRASRGTPRSFPPSFNLANIMEEMIGDMKEERRHAAEHQKK